MSGHMGADVPDRSRARPTHRYNLSAALTVVVLAILARFLRVGVIENDHYAYLSLAHQMLHGDWPVRDFFDPGMPLSYIVSAAAAAVFGPTLLTEAFTSVILFASGVLALYLCALRALNSAPAA